MNHYRWEICVAEVVTAETSCHHDEVAFVDISHIED